MYTLPTQAPRPHVIPLPHETYPFSIHPLLSSQTTLILDLSIFPIRAHDIPPDEATRPATHPPTKQLRIVHPSLNESILVSPSCPSSPHITVSDVLTAIHTVLSRPLSQTEIPAHSRADVLLYYQSTSNSYKYGGGGGGGRRVMRVVDLLEGASMFRGLEMDVARSNSWLGVIDGMQALTWILLTSEVGGRPVAYPISFSTSRSPVHPRVNNLYSSTGHGSSSSSSSSSSRYTPPTPVSSMGHTCPATTVYSQMAQYGSSRSRSGGGGGGGPQQQTVHYLAGGPGCC